MDRIRQHALARTRTQLRKHDLAAALLFDPLNVRYTTTVGPAVVFSLHNVDRWALVPVESEPVLWEYVSAMHFSEHWGGDRRPAPSWSAFGSGPLSQEHAREFAREIAAELKGRGILKERIGVDRLDAAGFLALQEAGVRIADAQLPLEMARAVKCPDEIEALRASARVCDAAVEALRERIKPGATENDIWAAFNGEAFRLGAEYNEARLLVSGPRTNPWLQEASMRAAEVGDFVAFDTDLIGPGGYLTDISRTYLCGDCKPTDKQRRLYAVAWGFLQEAIPLFRPGASFEELGVFLAKRLPPEFHPQRYPFVAHGVGLSDEYPAVLYDNHHPGELEANMVLSVEAYVGAVGGGEGVKLEEQILVKPDGHEVFSRAPYDDRLA
jgi:Xaa-Pro aminopeptidase